MKVIRTAFDIPTKSFTCSSWVAIVNTSKGSNHNGEYDINYEKFKVEYTKTFKRMMGYSPDQVGSGHYAEKLADLSDAYPEFEERLEDES